jgi:hypothetical protein
MSITRRVLRNMSFAFLSLFSSLLHSSFNPYIPLCVLFLDSLVLRFFPVFSIISIRMSCFNNRCCTTLPQQISIDLSLNVTICSLLSIWFEPKGNTRFWCWIKPKGNVCFNLQNKTKKNLATDDGTTLETIFNFFFRYRLSASSADTKLRFKLIWFDWKGFNESKQLNKVFVFILCANKNWIPIMVKCFLVFL